MTLKRLLLCITLILAVLVGWGLKRYETEPQHGKLSLEVKTQGILGRSIVGVVRNPYSYSVKAVHIEFDVLDAQGKKLEQTHDAVGQLGPNEEWNFSARLSSVEADGFRLLTASAVRGQ